MRVEQGVLGKSWCNWKGSLGVSLAQGKRSLVALGVRVAPLSGRKRYAAFWKMLVVFRHSPIGWTWAISALACLFPTLASRFNILTHLTLFLQDTKSHQDTT